MPILNFTTMNSAINDILETFLCRSQITRGHEGGPFPSTTFECLESSEQIYMTYVKPIIVHVDGG